MNIFRTCWLNVAFYDAVNIIHDVIITPNPFPYTAKFVFVGVRINKFKKMRRLKKNRLPTLLSYIKSI